MSLLFKMLSRLVITFHPRIKCCLISWLQWLWSPPNKVSHCFHCFPIYSSWSDWTGCQDLRFLPCLQSFPASGFSNEPIFHIRWPKYWSFSFSISPSSEYSGLISLELTSLISLLSKGLSRVFSNTTVWKHQFSPCSMASKLKDPRKDYKAPKIPRPWQ